MFKLFKFLITGSWHEHKWVVIKEVSITCGDDEAWTRYILQCQHCGCIKAVNPR